MSCDHYVNGLATYLDDLQADTAQPASGLGLDEWSTAPMRSF